MAGQTVEPVHRDQPRINADPRILKRMVSKEARQTGLRQGEGLPEVIVTLVGHLQRIATVAEQRGTVLQHQRKTRRSGKAAEKSKTFLGGGHLFALKHVLTPDIPAIKPPRGQDVTKTGQTFGCGNHGHERSCYGAVPE